MIVHPVLLVISVLCILPVVMVLSASFSTEEDLAANGYPILPREFSTQAYQYILKDPSQILRSYALTTAVTVVGSTLSLLMMSLFAYVLARQSFPWRNHLSFFLYFTMLFSGGLVPWYILITRYLKLRNTFGALIYPALLSPWYVFLLRTYFKGLPVEIIEAAKIDGASEWRIFFQIAVPLSTPALATVGLFSLLRFWNDWWLGMLFIDTRKWVPLQLLLYRIQNNIAFLETLPAESGIVIRVPAMTTRMALAVLAMGPIGLAYFGVQRYLIRGITIGAVKG
jgi:putative aldouronate transport system permease protein